MTGCIAKWAEISNNCAGDPRCLEESARQLRQCIEAAFPDSTNIEFENDKINYILSSTFFLANRLAKACIGLSEFDKAVTNLNITGQSSLESKENTKLYQKFEQDLDEILAMYF